MIDTELNLIPRRTFLQGTVLLAAATALGVNTKSEAAAGMTDPVQTTLMFWNEERFVAPTRLHGSSAFAGDETQIMIHGHALPDGAASRLLHGITIHHAVTINGKMRDVPFHAWTATWQTPTTSKVRVPLTPRQGLLLSATLRHDPTAHECHLLAAAHTPGQPLLREGTYVLAAGNPRWRGCRLQNEDGKAAIVRDTVSGPRPVGFEYVLLTVSVR